MKAILLSLTVIFTASATAVPDANHNTTRSNKTQGIAVPNGGNGAVPNNKVEKKGVATPDLNLHCANGKKVKKGSKNAKATPDLNLHMCGSDKIK